MLAVISPAKRLNLDTPPSSLDHSQPLLLGDTEELMGATRKLSANKLKQLMGISDTLAELNYNRFQQFTTPFTPKNAKQAALMFDGDTYTGLAADTLSEADLQYGQSHLAILSGLYGVLRPLDLMQPYRLEMGTALKNGRGKDLYSFWGGRITQELNALTEGHDERSVINLASNEYFRSVQAGELSGGVITPVFKDVRKGKAKVISFLAKRARGAMARYLLKERIEKPEGLKGFDEGGYVYQPDLSDERTFVFVRPEG